MTGIMQNLGRTRRGRAAPVVPAVSKCVGCNKSSATSNKSVDDWLQCDDEGCRGWWHDERAGVQAEHYKEPGCRWSCPNCVQVRQLANRDRVQSQPSHEEEEHITIAGTQEEDEHGYARRRTLEVVEPERVQVIGNGGGDEEAPPGGIQIEDEHGYHRRQGSPPPAPPPEPDLPSAHQAPTYP